MTKFTKRAAAVLTASLMLAGVVFRLRQQCQQLQTPSTGSDNLSTKVYKIVAELFAPFDFMDPYHGIYRHRYGLARCYRRGSGL